MRKLLLLAFATTLFKFSSAQITKGNWLVGGNIAFTHSRPKITGFDGESELDAAVNTGYFFINKLAAGVRLHTQIAKEKITHPDGSKQKIVQRNVGFGPFLRYYVLAPDKHVNLFGDAGLLYNINSNNTNSVHSKSLTSSLGAGAVVFLNQIVGLEGLLSYSHYALVDTDSDYSSNDFQFKVGLQVHLRKAK
ncbi:porin family protein [Chitinophagaceae bacterium LB-8]|uniref:Porin family protein n=1 Tax=Paraflavisolibacter caeni TaxID=2982496 RepID=A0A9X2XNM3_9BACT|nr:outer membrane beta-barrel protein [Paraflavisolibacter caeni]MCU7548594.1 porin family protein [Paraflavisolibacter caeni]